VRRRSLFGLGAGALAALAWPSWRVDAKPFTDSAGRRVDVPDPVLRVFPAGPPASVTLYTVAPEKMLGWTQVLGAEAQPFLPERYAALPELGRLTGRGNTVNLENVVKLTPDLVLDVGNTTATYVSLADRVQEQTRIPSVLIGGRLVDTAGTLRALGGLLDTQERAEALAGYAAAVIADVQKQTGKIPPAERPSIFIARGPHGLESVVAGSIGSEVVDLVGARNVVGKDTGPRTIVEVSPEQILAWQPDVILTIDRRFHAAIRTDPVWREVKAVQTGHIHFVPDVPFSWLDNPPAPNRLIGLLWLGHLLYPAAFPQDIRAEARRFYALFYQQEPSDAQLDRLFAEPTQG
jgi:iron complex transport system substrate-binding protein